MWEAESMARFLESMKLKGVVKCVCDDVAGQVIMAKCVECLPKVRKILDKTRRYYIHANLACKRESLSHEFCIGHL